MGDVFLRDPLGNQVTSHSMYPCTGIGSSNKVHILFSHIHVIKLDTNNSETKQGAAFLADMLQQKPNGEVIDLKSSAVPSDENRLAAGMCRFGLLDKRLSGA
jgi:hypothetical protein